MRGALFTAAFIAVIAFVGNGEVTDPLAEVPWTHFFIAANFYENRDVVLAFTDGLEELVRDYLCRHTSPLHVFVSIFSNGSEDDTTEIIENVLLPRLLAMEGANLGFWVVANGSTCGANIGPQPSVEPDGYYAKPVWMNRIEWMACVRNAAMQPLYEQGMHVFHPDGSRRREFFSGDNYTKFGGQDVRSGGAKYNPPVSADNIAVLFFNDIYFRTKDVVALLRTRQGFFDMACGMDFYYSFYDTWVTRDRDGRRFYAYPPYGSHPETQKTFAAFASLADVDAMLPATTMKDHDAAAEVRCCWNGLAALRGGLFINDMLRFRYVPVNTEARMKFATPAERDAFHEWHESAPEKLQELRLQQQQRDEKLWPSGKQNVRVNFSAHDDMECYTSECTLICEDIARIAWAKEPSSRSSRIFVNPTVQVAYEVPFFELHHRNYLITSGVLFRIISWLNVPSWPTFYTVPSQHEQESTDSGHLQCVLPEHVKTYTVTDLAVAVALVGAFLATIKRCRARRLRTLKLKL